MENMSEKKSFCDVLNVPVNTHEDISDQLFCLNKKYFP